MQTETKIKVENVMINEELENWMPPLSKEETDNLVDSLIDHGFDASYGKILVWNPMEEPDRYYIVDGHNRFKICQELNIELSDECFSVVDCQNEDAVKKLMLDIQLSRRNLSAIKRIEAAERCRPIYEKEAKEAQAKAGGDRKSEEYQKSVTPKLVEVISDRTDKETNAKLAKKAGIGKETHRKGVAILNSDNETVKQQVVSGEKSISAGYRELMKKPKEELPDETGLEPLYKVNEQIEKLYKKRKEIVESLAKDYDGRQIKVKYDMPGNELIKFFDVKGERLTYDCLLSEFPSKDSYENVPVEYQIDFCIAWHRAWTELQQEQLSA